MTDLRYYNNDPRYEMMLSILPDPQFDNLPDAGQIVEDLKEIVRLCHHYTIDDDTSNERAAWELARAIIDHLVSEWGKAPDLGQLARQYWVPGADLEESTAPSQDGVRTGLSEGADGA